MEATKKSKLLVIGFLILALGMIGLSMLAYQNTRVEHEEEIHQHIASIGGNVQEIHVVSLMDSPFSKGGKGNTIYKIIYVKDGVTKTAWYRAVNHSSIIREEESWIME